MSHPKLQKLPEPSLQGPRVEQAGSFLIAGLRRHYTDDRISRIPIQWQQFVSYLGRIPGQVGRATYGVCLTPASGTVGIDYLSGVEVSRSTGLPEDFSVVTISAQPYAVFVHRGQSRNFAIRSTPSGRSGFRNPATKSVLLPQNRPPSSSATRNVSIREQRPGKSNY